ncbi:MAG: hypothetical protein KC416_01705 [Myxococcales bacterium]|nr:hypothetical protein [Myxococcales bacterium]
MKFSPRPLAWLALLAVAGCDLSLDQEAEVIHAKFDPEAGIVPMPTDILRDDDAGHLDFDETDPDATEAERDFYGYLNGLDGWSTTQSGRVEFSGAIDPDSVTEESLQVWEWGDEPRRIEDIAWELDHEDHRIVITPPHDGWRRGRTYFAFVFAGAEGLRGRRGERIEPDPAFYFLRSKRNLDDPAYQRAFPGETREERLEKGRELEEVRRELAPYFEYLDGQGLDRKDIPALWGFTITERVELAMDKASQRMPIPFNLLLDRDTGLVDLPTSDRDKELERDAKEILKNYNGFSISAELLFRFTAEVDPETVTEKTVELYEVGGAFERVPARVEPFDGEYVAVIPEVLPLKQGTEYGVIVRQGVLDTEGRPIAPMSIGHIMRSEVPYAIDGISQSGSIDDESADKLEWVRRQISPLLDKVGRDGILTAWPFRTLSAVDDLRADVKLAETEDLDPNPVLVEEQTALDAILEFPLAVIGSSLEVSKVITGTIRTPVYLDENTHAFREDGEYEVTDVKFTMSIPKDVAKGESLPVAIFGHGIMTERRFVLAIADALARRGFAAVAIDLPYHGPRTKCVDSSPLAVVNPQSGEAMNLPPCSAGAVCEEETHVCLNGQGEEAFNRWPLVGFPIASGAAFLEIDTLPYIKDHFRQAYIDLGSLVHSLKHGDWEPVIGHPVKQDRFMWVGQSLGGIIGATFVAVTPEIHRAVLNVPGAGLVDLFDNSGFFGPQIDGYFVRQKIVRSSYEGRRFLNIARWLIDPVDPHSVAHLYREEGRHALIQKARGDFLVPNSSTDVLERISGLPVLEYTGTHAFLTIPEPAAIPGQRDMGDFLNGKLNP